MWAWPRTQSSGTRHKDYVSVTMSAEQWNEAERWCERDHERRAVERGIKITWVWPWTQSSGTRQVKVERLHECIHEQRAAEQVDARQARLAQSWKANRLRRQAERQPEPQQTNVPALEEDGVQGKLTAFYAKMSSLSFNHSICCNKSFPGKWMYVGEWLYYITHQWCNILYQLAQTRPHNVLHFLVLLDGSIG